MVEPVRDLQGLLDAFCVIGDADRIDDTVTAVDVTNFTDGVNGRAFGRNAIEDRRRRVNGIIAPVCRAGIPTGGAG